jgi:Leucine-rich repeat (LRR) protein
MAHNLFHEIPPAIATLQQLEILNMNHNCLDDVSGDAFSASLGSQLGALDFSSNNLTRIPVEALLALDNLSHLNLMNNSITDIGPHAFKSLANSLKYLYLHQNRLSNISTKAFQGLKHLEWLYLARNRLTTLHEETFRPVKKSLKILDIHGRLPTNGQTRLDGWIELSAAFVHSLKAPF